MKKLFNLLMPSHMKHEIYSQFSQLFRINFIELIFRIIIN